MTADLDAQPRLTKHFDSPFVVRLRLCFSPFFIIVFFIVQVSAKDPWCLLSIASYYHYPCFSHETTRLSIYVLSGQGGFLAFHHCGVYFVLEYGCPGILVVLSIVEFSAYDYICPSILDGAIYSV